MRGLVERGSLVPDRPCQPIRIIVEPDFPGRMDLGHENYLPGVHGEVLDHVIDRPENRGVAVLNYDLSSSLPCPPLRSGAE